MVIATEVRRKPLSHYLGLKYPVTLEAAPEGGYFVQIKDLPGCYSQGETVEEAMHMIEEAKQLWMESVYEDGMDIPEPRAAEDYSGKFFIRTPKSLHRDLARMAEREGVSLNQFLVATLARAVGAMECQPKRRRKSAK